MIVTIDVGLKNLAICVMDCTVPSDLTTYNIHLWEVYNTLDDSDTVNVKCEGLLKNGKICNKKCSLKYNDQEIVKYTCKLHFPKQQQIGTKNKIPKSKRVDDYLLQDITRIIILKVLEIYNSNIDIFKKVTKILIELQPKVNNKMKLISHILYSKFVELYIGTNTTVRFIRASQKLKAYTGPEIICKLKGAYAKRKWLSIQYTRWFLENKFNSIQTQRWYNSIQNSADKSDTFLMAINALHGLPLKQCRTKKGRCIS